MSVKAVYAIYNVTEETNGQVKAACQGRILTGDGTGASFNQDFVFDPTAPNVNSQIAAAVKTYLQNVHSVSFGSGDIVMLLPALL